MPALDLRKKAPPVAPASAPLPGNLPIAPGLMRLTEDEERALAAVNWQPGMPVPDIATALADVHADIAEQVLPTSPHLGKEMHIVDIESLTPEKRAEVELACAQMMDAAMQEQERRASEIPDARPGVNEAIHQVAAGQEKFRVTLGDEAKPAEGAATGQAAAPAGPCKNCGHARDEVAEVTDEDKRNFLLHIAGGRFVKEYTLYGGNLRLGFRTLTQKEYDEAIRQVGFDERDGLCPTPGEFFRRQQNYNQFLSLGSINGHLLPTLAEVSADPFDANGKPQTRLTAYVEHLIESHIQSETLLRDVTLLYNRFQAMLLRCEANKDTADFWVGIAPRA